MTKEWIDYVKNPPKDDADYDLIAIICDAKDEKQVNHFITKKPFMVKMHVEKYNAKWWFPLPATPL